MASACWISCAEKLKVAVKYLSQVGGKRRRPGKERIEHRNQGYCESFRAHPF
jgi:hypothetical protein